MATEQKINELPVMAVSSLSGNDHFLVVDDDKARLLNLSDFQTWIQTVVKGEKGDQGVAGKNGTNGTVGTNGTNGKSAYEIALDNGFSGSESDWIKSVQGVKGDKGDTGTNGLNGYSPVYRLVQNANGIFIQITDWIGGSGTKPSTGYLSSTGIVTNISNATSIQGSKGDIGLQGAKGDTGAQGSKGDTGSQGIIGDSAYQVAVDNGFTGTEKDWLTSLIGKPIVSLSYNDDNSITATDSSGSTIKTGIPNKTTGFCVISDSSFTATSPLNLVADKSTPISNDGSNKYIQYSGNLFTTPNILNTVVGGYYELSTNFTLTSDADIRFLIQDGDTLVASFSDGYKAGLVSNKINYYSETGVDLKIFAISKQDTSIHSIKQTILKIV